MPGSGGEALGGGDLLDLLISLDDRAIAIGEGQMGGASLGVQRPGSRNALMSFAHSVKIEIHDEHSGA